MDQKNSEIKHVFNSIINLCQSDNGKFDDELYNKSLEIKRHFDGYQSVFLNCYFDRFIKIANIKIEKNDPEWVRWCIITLILGGKSLVRSPPKLNQLLNLFEKQLCSGLESNLSGAFQIWQGLIMNFNLKKPEFRKLKRIKLLNIPILILKLPKNKIKDVSTNLELLKQVWKILMLVYNYQSAKSIDCDELLFAECLKQIYIVCFGVQAPKKYIDENFTTPFINEIEEKDLTEKMSPRPFISNEDLHTYIFEVYLQILNHDITNCTCVNANLPKLDMTNNDENKKILKMQTQKMKSAITLLTYALIKNRNLNKKQLTKCVWESFIIYFDNVFDDFLKIVTILFRIFLKNRPDLIENSIPVLSNVLQILQNTLRKADTDNSDEGYQDEKLLKCVPLLVNTNALYVLDEKICFEFLNRIIQIATKNILSSEDDVNTKNRFETIETIFNYLLNEPNSSIQQYNLTIEYLNLIVGSFEQLMSVETIFNSCVKSCITKNFVCLMHFTKFEFVDEKFFVLLEKIVHFDLEARIDQLAYLNDSNNVSDKIVNCFLNSLAKFLIKSNEIIYLEKFSKLFKYITNKTYGKLLEIFENLPIQDKNNEIYKKFSNGLVDLNENLAEHNSDFNTVIKHMGILSKSLDRIKMNENDKYTMIDTKIDDEMVINNDRKERMKERGKDIPALYQDLSNTNESMFSEDLFSSQNKKVDVKDFQVKKVYEFDETNKKTESTKKQFASPKVKKFLVLKPKHKDDDDDNKMSNEISKNVDNKICENQEQLLLEKANNEATCLVDNNLKSCVSDQLVTTIDDKELGIIDLIDKIEDNSNGIIRNSLDKLLDVNDETLNDKIATELELKIQEDLVVKDTDLKLISTFEKNDLNECGNLKNIEKKEKFLEEQCLTENLDEKEEKDETNRLNSNYLNVLENNLSLENKDQSISKNKIDLDQVSENEKLIGNQKVENLKQNEITNDDSKNEMKSNEEVEKSDHQNETNKLCEEKSIKKQKELDIKKDENEIKINEELVKNDQDETNKLCEEKSIKNQKEVDIKKDENEMKINEELVKNDQDETNKLRDEKSIKKQKELDIKTDENEMKINEELVKNDQDETNKLCEEKSIKKQKELDIKTDANEMKINEELVKNDQDETNKLCEEKSIKKQKELDIKTDANEMKINEELVKDDHDETNNLTKEKLIKKQKLTRNQKEHDVKKVEISNEMKINEELEKNKNDEDETNNKEKSNVENKKMTRSQNVQLANERNISEETKNKIKGSKKNTKKQTKETNKSQKTKIDVHINEQDKTLQKDEEQKENNDDKNEIVKEVDQLNTSQDKNNIDNDCKSSCCHQDKNKKLTKDISLLKITRNQKKQIEINEKNGAMKTTNRANKKLQKDECLENNKNTRNRKKRNVDDNTNQVDTNLNEPPNVSFPKNIELKTEKNSKKRKLKLIGNKEQNEMNKEEESLENKKFTNQIENEQNDSNENIKNESTTDKIVVNKDKTKENKRKRKENKKDHNLTDNILCENKRIKHIIIIENGHQQSESRDKKTSKQSKRFFRNRETCNKNVWLDYVKMKSKPKSSQSCSNQNTENEGNSFETIDNETMNTETGNETKLNCTNNDNNSKIKDNNELITSKKRKLKISNISDLPETKRQKLYDLIGQIDEEVPKLHNCIININKKDFDEYLENDMKKKNRSVEQIESSSHQNNLVKSPLKNNEQMITIDVDNKEALLEPNDLKISTSILNSPDVSYNEIELTQKFLECTSDISPIKKPEIQSNDSSSIGANLALKDPDNLFAVFKLPLTKKNSRSTRILNLNSKSTDQKDSIKKCNHRLSNLFKMTKKQGPLRNDEKNDEVNEEQDENNEWAAIDIDSMLKKTPLKSILKKDSVNEKKLASTKKKLSFLDPIIHSVHHYNLIYPKEYFYGEEIQKQKKKMICKMNKNKINLLNSPRMTRSKLNQILAKKLSERPIKQRKKLIKLDKEIISKLNNSKTEEFNKNQLIENSNNETSSEIENLLNHSLSKSNDIDAKSNQCEDSSKYERNDQLIDDLKESMKPNENQLINSEEKIMKIDLNEIDDQIIATSFCENLQNDSINPEFKLPHFKFESSILNSGESSIKNEYQNIINKFVEMKNAENLDQIKNDMLDNNEMIKNCLDHIEDAFKSLKNNLNIINRSVEMIEKEIKKEKLKSPISN